MNKIIQININGMVFSIDEHAYEQLRQYLDRLRTHFKSVEGGHEIIADIEARIAELLQERLHAQKQVVGEVDIHEVISIMGDPSQMAGEEETQPRAEEPRVNYTSFEKRLFRDPDDRVLGGVCSGLGAYFGIESVWIRLAFAFAFFALGSGLLLYIILWVVIPKANTTAEKLQMRGKPVDINNIEKKIKEELKDVETQFSEFAKTTKPKAQDGFRRVVEVMVRVLAMLAIAITRFIGFVIAVISVILFITLIGLILGLSWPVSFSPFSFLEMLFASHMMFYIGVTGFLLVSIIPLVFFVYVGIKLLFSIKIKNKYFNKAAASLFSLGILLTFISGIYLAKEFSAGTKTSSVIPVQASRADTLYVDVKQLSSAYSSTDRLSMNGTHVTLFDDNSFLIEDMEVNIEQSDKDEFELVRVVHSRGRSISEAAEASKLANPQIDQNDSTLVFYSGFKLAKTKPWRHQEVSYKLKVPVGKTVVFMNGANQLTINDGAVYSNTSWTMTAAGFTCNNCESVQASSHNGHALGKYNRSYPVESFNRVEVRGMFEVNIRKGVSHRVTADAEDEDAFKNISVYVKGNTLQLNMDKNFLSLLEGLGSKPVGITIEVPDLMEVKAGGANEIYLHQFSGKKLVLDISGACQVKGSDLTFDHLRLDLSGASNVKIDGACDELEADLSGACELEAFDFTCKTVSVDCSGASSAKVYATKTIKADAGGTSEIEYKGGPNFKFINQHGAAEVEAQD